MVQVFVRKHTPHKEADFPLKKLDVTKRYRITDLDGGEWEVDGKTLTEKGLSLRIETKRTAKIYFYRVIE